MCLLAQRMHVVALGSAAIRSGPIRAPHISQRTGVVASVSLTINDGSRQAAARFTAVSIGFGGTAQEHVEFPLADRASGTK